MAVKISAETIDVVTKGVIAGIQTLTLCVGSGQAVPAGVYDEIVAALRDLKSAKPAPVPVVTGDGL